MTLIAGIRCRDGYIIAADTALTTGASVSQGRKIDEYVGDDYRIIVACCGHMAHAKMASQRIRDDVNSLGTRSFPAVKAAVQEAVRDIYAKHIAALYWMNQQPAPSFSLIISIECESLYAVLATDDSAVFEIDTHEFRGTGQEVATFLAQRLLIERRTMSIPLLTSEAVHIVQHMFKAAKTSADGVGGNTEILARLTAKDAKQFFNVSFSTIEDAALNHWYLWSLDESVSHCVWSALRAGGFEKHLKKVEGVLQKLRDGSKKRDEISSRTMHLVELENGEWSANFWDGQPTKPWLPTSNDPPLSHSPMAVPMPPLSG